jgi:hypothetical protein
LLWSEWVRFCLKQAKKFPRRVQENRFDTIMTGKLHLIVIDSVIDEHFFGPVYDGIQFVPGKHSKQFDR